MGANTIPDVRGYLRLVEGARRGTLVVRSVSGGGTVLEWNVICGGENETVFFDL